MQALFVSSSIAPRSDASEAFKPTDGAFDAGISMRAEVGALCATQAMLQEYHLIGSVRPEGMITNARRGRRPFLPAAAIAMRMLLVVNIPSA
ncbi:hypothetical protein BC360_21845 [Ensifer sp. LC163]|nr:hypothetical protein BC360_21845 [Ensifer sp. LC163]